MRFFHQFAQQGILSLSGRGGSLKRNKYAFGLGTIGRDMVYSMVSMYLTYYLTDIIQVSTSVLWWITGIMLLARVFDALNDPVKFSHGCNRG